MNDHPITPPPEPVDQWTELPLSQEEQLVVAAQWGADQELEACCEWLCAVEGWKIVAHRLHSARRPKPPSLKEQALAALDDAVMRGDCITISDALPTIRRALEQLND